MTSECPGLHEDSNNSVLLFQGDFTAFVTLSKVP